MQIIELDWKEFVSRSNVPDGRWLSVKQRLDLVNNRVPGDLPQHSLVVAGGFIRDLLLNQDSFSDIDVFSVDCGILSVYSYTNWCETLFDKAVITKSTPKYYEGTMHGYKTQIINRLYQSVGEILSSFDYTLCCFVTDFNKLWTTPEALWDTGRMKLVPQNITYPISSLRRLIKYTSKGFRICNGGLNDLLEKVSKATPENRYGYID